MSCMFDLTRLANANHNTSMDLAATCKTPQVWGESGIDIGDLLAAYRLDDAH